MILTLNAEGEISVSKRLDFDEDLRYFEIEEDEIKIIMETKNDNENTLQQHERKESLRIFV